MRPVVLLALLALAACRDEARCDAVTVLAAESLEPALSELLAGEPGIRASYAASGALLRQLEAGAPGDLFLSAGEAEARAAVALRGSGPSRLVAENELVLVVPGDNPARVRGSSDLVSERVRRVAIGRAPAVPAGRYAREALARLGLALGPRLIEADGAVQALAYVRSGEVDAGLVYRSDARRSAGAVLELEALPTTSAIGYHAVVLRGACEPRARRLLDRIASGEGRAALARHGFAPP